MKQIRPTTIDSIVAVVQENKRVYDLLTPEERAEVDDFNARMDGKSIVEIIAMGTHPFGKYQHKYGK